jgi:tetratricopeptide (TPR) repeat protein
MVAPGDDMYEIALRLVAASLHVNAFDYDRARELLLEARELAAPRPHQRRLLCSCHEGLARLALDLLDESAAEHIEAAAVVALEIGQAVILAIMPLMRGRLAFAAGDHERAVRLMEQSCAMHEAIGGRLHGADTMQFLGRALVEMKRPSEARAAFERALEGHAAIGATADASADRVLIADTWCRDGESARAVELVEAELPAIEALGALDPSAAGIAARAAVWRVFEAVGDMRAARQLDAAMTDLRRRTEKIRDPVARQRLLDGVPLYRELAAAWAASGRA